MLHISVVTDTYIDELVEIFLKLPMKTVQVHLIIWMTLHDEKTSRLDETYNDNCPVSDSIHRVFFLSFSLLSLPGCIAMVVWKPYLPCTYGFLVELIRSIRLFPKLDMA